MPPAAAPILLSANPSSLTNGRAVAAPPATGTCTAYYWMFSPVGGGSQVNATTTSLTITTSNSLVPGGLYDTKVACVQSGKAGAASRSLLQVKLGPFSNTLRFVMPAPGAPFVEAAARGATTAAAAVKLPSGFTHRLELTVCVLGGACRTVPCTKPSNCELTRLEPGTSHSVTAVAFNAANDSSATSNTAGFITCPLNQPLVCGSTCIAASTCCQSEPSVGTSCVAPLVCPSNGSPCGKEGIGQAGGYHTEHLRSSDWVCWSMLDYKCHLLAAKQLPSPLSLDAGCPAGKVKCGSLCINPATQCCKTSSAAGLPCSAPEECLADGDKCGELSALAQFGSFQGAQCNRPPCLNQPGACFVRCRFGAGCPAGKVKCGSLCINPATQCCKTSSAAGLPCTAPEECLADGGTCGEHGGATAKLLSARHASGGAAVSPKCPSRLLRRSQLLVWLIHASAAACATHAGCAAGKVKCGSLCINPATQCCLTGSAAGLPCAASEECSADGGTCGGRGGAAAQVQSARHASGGAAESPQCSRCLLSRPIAAFLAHSCFGCCLCHSRRLRRWQGQVRQPVHQPCHPVLPHWREHVHWRGCLPLRWRRMCLPHGELARHIAHQRCCIMHDASICWQADRALRGVAQHGSALLQPMGMP